MMRVSELMTPVPVQVSTGTPIATCAARMEHLAIRHLPVVAEDGRLVGVVTDAAIHRVGAMFGTEFVVFDSRDEATVAGQLSTPPEVVASPEDDLPVVMNRLVATRQDCVVVVDEHQHPIGIVTEHDLLKVALEVVPIRLTVDHLPARPLITLERTAPAAWALDAMARMAIRHVPVTDPDGTLVGVVSYRDLIADDVARRSVTLDEVVRSADVFHVAPGTPLVTCARSMIDHRVGCLPVVKSGRAERIVTRRDLVYAAATGLETEELFGGPSQ
ncbi:MAG: CBS domain-containing protein [Myxococcota bacterium]